MRVEVRPSRASFLTFLAAHAAGKKPHEDTVLLDIKWSKIHAFGSSGVRAFSVGGLYLRDDEGGASAEWGEFDESRDGVHGLRQAGRGGAAQ